MGVAIARPAPVAAKPKRKIPESLIYEVMDGQPVYRKGWRSVLNKTKTLDEIMGSSTLKSEIIFCLLRILMKNYDEQKYTMHTNESGLHISKNVNLAGDIFLYDRRAMTAENINKFYSTVPPLMVFEIDVKAELEDESDLKYIQKKTQKLLDFGVQKVFWIITDAQKIIVSETGKASSQIVDWDLDIEISENLTFNIGKYLAEKGVVV